MVFPWFSHGLPWFFGQENLTCDEPEPKVPAVIIERLRLPGGIGGAAKTCGSVVFMQFDTEIYDGDI